MVGRLVTWVLIGLVLTCTGCGDKSDGWSDAAPSTGAGAASASETPSGRATERCADFVALGADEQRTAASGWISRVGDNAVSNNADALADQVRQICERETSFTTSEAAATVITLAKTNHLTDYDEPLP